MADRIEIEGLRRTWHIETPTVPGGRYGWSIPYPLNGFRITGIKTYATKSWAGRAAMAHIRKYGRPSND